MNGKDVIAEKELAKGGGFVIRNEKRETKLDGAKPIPNSGRGNLKGDSLLDGEILIDYKHVGKSHTVNKDAWLKHKRDAWNDGQYEPALKIVMGDESLAVAVIDWEYFLELREYKLMYEGLSK